MRQLKRLGHSTTCPLYLWFQSCCHLRSLTLIFSNIALVSVDCKLMVQSKYFSFSQHFFFILPLFNFLQFQMSTEPTNNNYLIVSLWNALIYSRPKSTVLELLVFLLLCLHFCSVLLFFYFLSKHMRLLTWVSIDWLDIIILFVFNCQWLECAWLYLLGNYFL